MEREKEGEGAWGKGFWKGAGEGREGVCRGVWSSEGREKGGRGHVVLHAWSRTNVKEIDTRLKK